MGASPCVSHTPLVAPGRHPGDNPTVPGRWPTGAMTTRPRFAVQLLAALGRRSNAYRDGGARPVRPGFARQLVRALARDTAAFTPGDPMWTSEGVHLK